MPVQTRSQTQRLRRDALPNGQNANSNLSSKLSEDSPHITTSKNFLQKPVALKKSRKAKEALPPPQKPQKRPRKRQNSNKSKPTHTTTSKNFIHKPGASKKACKAKAALSSSQKPQKRLHKHQNSNKSEPSQTAIGSPSPDRFDNTIVHWACKDCSCPQGFFDYPVDCCKRCEHIMDRHEHVNRYLDPGCDYICERNNLTASIMRLLDVMRVVIIRATPQAGKTTLLLLLGLHVLYERRDLEPIWVHWETREQRKNLPYEQFLEENRLLYQERNAEFRPRNPNARTLYLIDEGQGSYEESNFWTKDLKNHNTRQKPMFVIVCLYGADVSIRRSLDVESQSLKVSSVQRVELRPSRTNNPYILFTLEETTIAIQKWAMLNKFELTDDVYQYLHTATDGHPGMVGFVLGYFDTCVRRVRNRHSGNKVFPLTLYSLPKPLDTLDRGRPNNVTIYLLIIPG